MRMSRLVLLAGLCAPGCGEDAATPMPSDASPPPATAPTTVPADPAALPSAAVTVADEPYLLPPMVLRFRAVGEGAGLLVSGHEKAEPTGNTLVLAMTTPAQDLVQLAAMPWTFQAATDEWTDTPQGVSLRDERYVLRPYNVTVRFEPGESTVKVTINGDFLRFDTNANPELAGRPTPVEAEFDAALVVQPPP